jgi:hypothetical protein
MFNIVGIRSYIGSRMINNALIVFNKTIVTMEKGIEHLRADKAKHLQTAAEAQYQADECDRAAKSADKILTKIKALVED